MCLGFFSPLLDSVLSFPAPPLLFRLLFHGWFILFHLAVTSPAPPPSVLSVQSAALLLDGHCNHSNHKGELLLLFPSFLLAPITVLHLLGVHDLCSFCFPWTAGVISNCMYARVRTEKSGSQGEVHEAGRGGRPAPSKIKKKILTTSWSLLFR